MRSARPRPARAAEPAGLGGRPHGEHPEVGDVARPLHELAARDQRIVLEGDEQDDPGRVGDLGQHAVDVDALVVEEVGLTRPAVLRDSGPR